MKKFFVTVLISLLIAACLTVPAWGEGNRADTPPEDTLEAVTATTISEDYIPSEKTVVEVTPEQRIEKLRGLMADMLEEKERIHVEADELRAQGYVDTDVEIQDLKNEYAEAEEQYYIYNDEYRELWIGSDAFWAEKEAEYPTATYVWRYMKDLGYSDAVAAGIMGNMMLECAHGDLNLEWSVYDDSGRFYGLCQWGKTWFPEVQGASLEEQMNCLRDTIEEQIDGAGFAYGGDGWGYDEFLQLENCEDVAMAFATAYERCPLRHRWPRMGYSVIAYDYFTN